MTPYEAPVSVWVVKSQSTQTQVNEEEGTHTNAQWQVGSVPTTPPQLHRY